jgi:hypothetical protein
VGLAEKLGFRASKTPSFAPLYFSSRALAQEGPSPSQRRTPPWNAIRNSNAYAIRHKTEINIFQSAIFKNQRVTAEAAGHDAVALREVFHARYSRPPHCAVHEAINVDTRECAGARSCFGADDARAGAAPPPGLTPDSLYRICHGSPARGALCHDRCPSRRPSHRLIPDRDMKAPDRRRRDSRGGVGENARLSRPPRPAPNPGMQFAASLGGGMRGRRGSSRGPASSSGGASTRWLGGRGWQNLNAC